MAKTRLATLWLDGCSGCHMSFIDLDERLLALADRVDLVYSPLVDVKVFPSDVDITLVEGSISTKEDLEMLRRVRGNTAILVSFGDCAITANISSLRNQFALKDVLDSVYLNRPALNPQIPSQRVPTLLKKSLPVHQVVKVDVYIPGCPPSADTIFYALSELLEGRTPDLTRITRFGA